MERAQKGTIQTVTTGVALAGSQRLAILRSVRDLGWKSLFIGDAFKGLLGGDFVNRDAGESKSSMVEISMPRRSNLNSEKAAGLNSCERDVPETYPRQSPFNGNAFLSLSSMISSFGLAL
jgi:hypothetical protein